MRRENVPADIEPGKALGRKAQNGFHILQKSGRYSFGAMEKLHRTHSK
jgi:hypothetical protein